MSLIFKMVSGDSKQLNITATESDGTAIDLTGVSAIKWSLFSTTNGTEILTKTLGSGITVTTALSGVFAVVLDPADTTSLSGEYRHEVQITDASSNILTLSENTNLDSGTLTIRKDLIT